MRRLLSALAAVAMVGAVSALGAVAPVVDAQADPRNGIPPDQAPSTLQAAPLDAAVSGLGSSSLVAGAVPARPAQADVLTQAQPQATGPSLLRLDVTQLTPRVIRAGTADQMRVVGQITNVGDRRVEDISMRIQRGNALTSENDLRGAIGEPARADQVRPAFHQVADFLDPGQSAQVDLTIPLRGSPQDSLAITQPGVYPLLLNVNGTPANGGAARLAALSTLLPVLSLPGGQSTNRPATPAGLTLLWPLADQPRLVSQDDGSGTAVLSDDELATSLAAGGRLHALLQAYGRANTGPLATSLCLAVDPDLLLTVDAMTRGYRVQRDGQTVTGTGQETAQAWLSQLQQLTAQHCVLPLPYADADLVALSRVGLTDLANTALAGGVVPDGLRPDQARAQDDATIVTSLLDTAKPLTGVVWPSDGALDENTLTMLAGHGTKAVLTSPNSLSAGSAAGLTPLATAGGSASVASVRIDPLISDALAGGAGQQRDAAGTNVATVSVQDALAALIFRTAFAGGGGQPLVVAPPRRWTAPQSELNTFLQEVAGLYDEQFARPASLADLVASPASGPASTLAYPPQAASAELPRSVTATLTEQESRVRGLSDAMSKDDSTDVRPEQLTGPLRNGLLRAVSGAWRGNQPAAEAALRTSSNQIGAIQGSITITSPTTPITRASGDSPVPVSLTNKLPVVVKVRLVFAHVPGIQPQDMSEQLIPAGSSRNVFVKLEAVRSGQFSLSVHLTTPDGVFLGQYARLEVTSTNYGTITLVVTGTAAAALVLLSVRRIRRRVKAEHPAADAPATPAGDLAPTAKSTDSTTDDSTDQDPADQHTTADQDQPTTAPAAGQERSSKS